MDTYIPPKEFVKKEQIISKNNELAFFDSVKTFFSTNSLSLEEIKKCASFIKEIFADGFQWHDIADIMQLALKYFSNYSSLNPQEKRDAVLKAVDFLIDITDTPFLPDSIFDPIFKSLAFSFAHLVVPDDENYIKPKITYKGSPTEDVIRNFTDELIEEYNKKLEFEDISIFTSKSIKFVNQYSDISSEEKATLAKQIVNDIIDHCQTPLINGQDSDYIFKDLAFGFINHLTGVSKIFND